MLNILSILRYTLTSLQSQDQRFQMLDDEHVMDTKTGVKYCMYDDYCEIMHKDQKVLSVNQLTKEEQTVIWEIKQAITDPAKAQEKKDNYPAMVQKKREALSHLYEHPEPLTDNSVEPEPDAEVYEG